MMSRPNEGILEIGEGRWNVKFSYHVHRSSYNTIDERSIFVKAKDLQHDDCCAFKLISEDENLMRVLR
ncbi:hypothetical protein O6P43_002696 [Quillaja saponaria]|uniref:Uncharacterized protein n=1 Tax=Quillaja saponaria TaxID=32244 RepID=A0AAD7QD29_QUISA|nr:hypothetical protein O6P43_002696 [Quillaja saponaria]